MDNDTQCSSSLYVPYSAFNLVGPWFHEVWGCVGVRMRMMWDGMELKHKEWNTIQYNSDSKSSERERQRERGGVHKKSVGAAVEKHWRGKKQK